MASGRTIINQTNNIVYVEPTYVNSIESYDTGGLETFELTPDLEDYSIFVNLEVETIGRTIQTGNKVYRFSYVSRSNGESINLMGGSKINTANGPINTLTTNYTDYHISDLKGTGASPELFGINYIDIAYNNFMVPEITIEFVDVRGASVFGQKEAFETNIAEKAIGVNNVEDITNTFFQCFFTFPYPKFTIVVKGFYGEPVAYELSCTDFRARFDSETGNFSCTAKFLGYYFSFLNDVVVNALYAAPYSDFLGNDYWNKKAFKIKGINGGEINMKTLPELINLMKDAETKSEQESQSSPEVQEKNNLEQVSEKYNNIKVLYENYINAIKTLVVSKNSSSDVTLFISDLTDNNISECAIILAEEDAEGEKFENYFDDSNDTVSDAYDALNDEINKFKDEFNDISFPSLSNFAESVPKKRIFEHPTETSKCIIDSDNANDDVKERSQNLYNVFETNVLSKNNTSEKNKYLDTPFGYFFNDNGFSKALNDAIASASKQETELTEKISENKKAALAERLGFSPSIENITRILMAHFETFAYMIFESARLIDNEDPKRDTKKVGIQDDDDITDVPEKYRSSEGYLLVPPYPKVTKIVEKKGIRTREETWTGEYGNVFLETDVVNGLLNGIERFKEILASGEAEASAGAIGSTSTIHTLMKYPLSTLDFFSTKETYGSFDQTNVSSLLGLVGLRALEILGTTNFDDWDDNCELLGRAEAENLLNQKINLSNDLKEKIKALSTDIDSVMNMLEGQPSGSIQKPSNDVWPWQYSTESVGIVHDGELNICKVKGVNGSTTYCLPIQDLSWEKIKRDVIDSSAAATSDDYFNVADTLLRNVSKDNIFNIETNINRIKNICESQMTGLDGIEEYRDKVLDEATYDSDTYDNYFDNEDELIAYPIDGADKLLPYNNSKMIPCTTNYVKKMTWGGGFDMDDFIDEDLDGAWKDKDGNEVKRKGEDGDEKFFEDLDTRNFTITEIPGLDKNLKPNKDISLFTEKLYYMQKDDRVKAFMLLCSLGYLFDYEEIFEEELCEEDKTISIIPLPAILFAGGILWALEGSNRKKFINCHPSWGVINDCNDELLKLDRNVRLKLKKIFEKWVTDGIPNNSMISSFNSISNKLEISLIHEGRTYNEFFDSLGEMEDESWFFSLDRTWFNEGIFKNCGYNGVLDLFVGEFGENFFRNYICVDEDLGGEGDTIGMRVGNRDGSPGIRAYVDFALAPCLFTKSSKFFFEDTEKRIKVETGNLRTFFKGFIDRISEEVVDNQTDNSISHAKNNEKVTNDVKVGIYRYCKLLYDKWIGGMSETDFEKFTMNEFFESDTKYFHFIDAYYNYANEITVNIGNFCEIVLNSLQQNDYSLLSLLSLVYSQNKFLLLCVQNFMDLSSRERMIKMFDCVPYTEINWENINKHSNFVAIYTYEPSSHLDMGNNEYNNDGFMINRPEGINNKWPEALKSRNAGTSAGLNVPAFGVSYGKMYQSYFKNVIVSMDNPTVTEQVIKAAWNIISPENEKDSQADESKEYTYGQDLYSIYSNNSYTCEVTMMGCAWVQPMMLFVLNNVPMFRGTYQIINVTHHIEQGDMVTKFKGVRMANTTTRLVEENCARNKSTQTGEGINTQVNQASSYANTDNDCAYAEYPLSSNDDINLSLSNDENYNASQIMTKIMAKGYTKEQAAGIVGNMAVESPGFKADINVCDSNLKWAGGLCMWNNNGLYWLMKGKPDKVSQPLPEGESMSCSPKWSKKTNGNMPSADQQVTFLLDSLEQDSYLKKTRKVKEHLITAKTPEQAAFYFARDFEACSECKDEGSSTVKKRKQNARKFYDNYTDVATPPPIVDNGDEHISALANGFLNALNKTSQSSAIKVEIGVDKDKSNGDTIYLTNANKSQDFGKILDIMLQTYSNRIEEIRWLVPGNGENQNVPPAAYIVTLKEGSAYNIIRVANESNNEMVSQIAMSGDGGINPDFKKAIVKKFKNETNRENLVMKYVQPSISEEEAKKLFDDNTVKDCNSVMGGNDGGGNSSYGEVVPGAGSNSTWAAAVQTMGKWYESNIHNYSQSQYTMCSLTNSKVRHDCSGYVSACLQYFGAFKKGYVTTSCGFTTDKSVAKMLTDAGFAQMSFSYDVAEPFDIVSYCGHVEILASKGSPIKDWGWGSCHDGRNGHNGMPANADGKRYRNNVYKSIWRYKA